MPRFVCGGIVAVICFVCTSAARAAVSAAAAFPAVKTAQAPAPSADLNDSAWRPATRAGEFQNFTTQRSAGALKTTALLLYDDDNLYVGFICAQPGIPITATQAVNEVGYGVDDAVTFSVDTSGSNSRTYAFTATPHGVKYEYSSESSRYQPQWRVDAKISGDGYRVMMVIPLADIRAHGSGSQTWRLNFSRRVAAAGDLLTWAYDSGSNAYCNNLNLGATIYCDSTRWPSLGGIAATGFSKPPPAYADVYGLESAGRDRHVFETTPENFTSQTPRNVGLDATLPFTPTLAFVTALGPDFSNVETDQTTIAPQEFAKNYTEYRPFFAEGANFISTVPTFGVHGINNSMFYSPSLGIVDSGFKVEGTAAQHSIGALDVKGDAYNDRALGYAYTSPDTTFTASAQAVSARHPGIRDDTAGIGLSYQNLRSGFNPVVSYEKETGNTVGEPSGAHQLVIAEVTNHGFWQTGADFRDVSPTFSPVDGYTALPDIRGPQAFAVYSGIGNGPRIKSYQLVVIADRYLDRSGASHQVDLFESAGVTTRDLISLTLSGSTSGIRTYRAPYPAYTNPQNVAFNQTTLSLGYHDGTPSPTDVSYGFGPFAVACPFTAAATFGGREPLPCHTSVNGYAPAYTQQFDATTTRAFKGGFSATVEYGGNVERAFAGTNDAQWLRRLAITRAFGNEGQLALSLRQISGTGGFALPGTSLALSYHARLRNQNQFYFEYGSPASYATLQRFVIKYVLHVGKGGAGT